MNEAAFTVSELTGYIKNRFDSDLILNGLYVKGEVSNCKYHSSGHIYFSLKDSNAQIACVMFAGRRTGISFSLEDGQSVIVFGRASVYEATGRYQIYADEIRLDGIGKLYEQFEELKRRLEAEGLFDISHKKPIPKYAKKIGIVTAATGAAVRDICQISRRRNPYVSLVLYPARVQGEGAAETIVRGIRTLDGKVDTIIVGRGGGSIEDLWAFNEEITVRAIYECRTPVISAVGHETDTTISDFAADLRAPTPSAGAELAVFDLAQLEKSFALMHERLTGAIVRRIDLSRQLISNREIKFRSISPRNILDMKKEKLASKKTALSGFMTNLLAAKKALKESLAARLHASDPVRKLESGFSYIADVKGKKVSSVSTVDIGDTIYAYMTDGVITAAVTEKKEKA